MLTVYAMHFVVCAIVGPCRAWLYVKNGGDCQDQW